MMTATLLTSGIVICLLVRIAFTDIRARVISNRDIVILFSAVCMMGIFSGKMPNMFLAVAVLSIGMLLFQGNVMGGGDVKLLAVLSLLFEWSPFMSFLFTTALVGGLIALMGIICFRQVTLRLGVPYGVAIAIAFVLSDTYQVIVSETEIFS